MLRDSNASSSQHPSIEAEAELMALAQAGKAAAVFRRICCGDGRTSAISAHVAREAIDALDDMGALHCGRKGARRFGAYSWWGTRHDGIFFAANGLVRAIIGRQRDLNCPSPDEARAQRDAHREENRASHARIQADREAIVARLLTGEPVQFCDGQEGGRALGHNRPSSIPDNDYPDYPQASWPAIERACARLGRGIRMRTEYWVRPGWCGCHAGWAVKMAYLAPPRAIQPVPHHPTEEALDRATHGHRAKTDRRARCVAKRERKVCVPPPRKRRPRPESRATVAQKNARRAEEARKNGRLSSL